MFRLALLGMLLSGVVFAEESEYRKTLETYLEGYTSQVTSACKITPKIVWGEKKVQEDPNYGKTEKHNPITTLCGSAIDAVNQACDGNEAVQGALKKVTKIVCKRGTGPVKHELKGSELILSVDTAYDKNNPAGQASDLTAKLKKSLDT